MQYDSHASSSEYVLACIDEDESTARATWPFVHLQHNIHTQQQVATVIVASIYIYGMVWYGMVNVDLYSAIITIVSNALNTLVSGEKPGFQALSKGLIVLLCTEVVRQGVPDHGAVHSECSASNSG